LSAIGLLLLRVIGDSEDEVSEVRLERPRGVYMADEDGQGNAGAREKTGVGRGRGGPRRPTGRAIPPAGLAEPPNLGGRRGTEWSASQKPCAMLIT